MPRAAKLSNGMTLKQMAFAKEWVMNGGKDIPAYRAAYDAEGMSDRTVSRRAIELRDNSIIAACIEDIQGDILAASKVTAAGIVARTIAIADYGMQEEVKPQSKQEQEEGVEVQLRQVNPSAAVSALNLAADIMGVKAATKAKLEVEDTTNRADFEKLQEVRRLFTQEEKKRVYYLVTVEGVEHMAAVDQVYAERETKLIEGEIVGDDE